MHLRAYKYVIVMLQCCSDIVLSHGHHAGSATERSIISYLVREAVTFYFIILCVGTHLIFDSSVKFRDAISTTVK